MRFKVFQGVSGFLRRLNTSWHPHTPNTPTQSHTTSHHTRAHARTTTRVFTQIYTLPKTNTKHRPAVVESRGWGQILGNFRAQDALLHRDQPGGRHLQVLRLRHGGGRAALDARPAVEQAGGTYDHRRAKALGLGWSSCWIMCILI